MAWSLRTCSIRCLYVYLFESLAGVSGLFIEGTMVAALIDRDGVVAYLLSASSSKGFVAYSGDLPEHRMNGTLYGQILADFET